MCILRLHVGVTKTSFREFCYIRQSGNILHNCASVNAFNLIEHDFPELKHYFDMKWGGETSEFTGFSKAKSLF